MLREEVVVRDTACMISQSSLRPAVISFDTSSH